MDQHAEAEKLEVRLSTLEMALRPQGLLGEIAASVVDGDVVLEPSEAVDVILPPKNAGEPAAARWQLVEDAPAVIKEAVDAKRAELLILAFDLGMRKHETVNDSDIERISPDTSIWVIEGGANRTSVVRRELAIEVMRKTYDDIDISEHVIYQLGSGERTIPRERNGQPNAEYVIAQEIAGDFLPEDEELTEFGLNLASALQSGYEIDGTMENEFDVAKVIGLKKEGYPNLVLVQPKSTSNGLKDGLSAVSNLLHDIEGCQFVIATNGQYRPKDELQAVEWAKEHGLEMQAPVAVGDEPGYTVEHNGKQIKTAERAPTAYLNEMVILHRLATAS